MVLAEITKQDFSTAFIMLIMTGIFKQHLNFCKTLYVEFRARAANFVSSKPQG